MLLSIILPIFNVEAYIGLCLQSILDTGGDSSQFEVILVNDGTRDRSMSIVHNLCSNRPNIRIIEQENQGLSAARMNGLSVAQGEYIWFVDSDDWLEEDAINTAINWIKRITPDVLITPLHWRFTTPNKDYLDINLPDNIQCKGKDCLFNSISPVWAAQRFILRKKLFEENKWLFFPLKTLHEDEYFGRILLYSTDSIYILKDPLYNYRQRENSIMGTISTQNAYDIVKLHKLLTSFLKNIVKIKDRTWFRRNIFKNVLLTSYYRCSSLFGDRAFNIFLRKNRNYIIFSYFKTSPNKSIYKILGDIAFLLFPHTFSRYKGLRYIE